MNKYPSDEELELWIHNLEQEELYAPRHLKEEIMHKALQSKKNSPPVSFLSYTVKMVAGMAAAVVLTFVIPVNDGTDISMAQIRMERIQEENERREEKLQESLVHKERLDKKIAGHMNRTRKQMDDAAEQVFNKMKGFWNRENGGNK